MVPASRNPVVQRLLTHWSDLPKVSEGALTFESPSRNLRPCRLRSLRRSPAALAVWFALTLHMLGVRQLPASSSLSASRHCTRAPSVRPSWTVLSVARNPLAVRDSEPYMSSRGWRESRSQALVMRGHEYDRSAVDTLIVRTETINGPTRGCCLAFNARRVFRPAGRTGNPAPRLVAAPRRVTARWPGRRQSSRPPFPSACAAIPS